MSAYELIIKLKQQTPYIHFQHDQYGATLRASEVKPKLDKFILKKLEEEEKNNQSWFVGYKKDKKSEICETALNYKMRFRTIGNKKNVGDIKDYKFYFGNMGKGNLEKKIIFQDVEMTIVCFFPDLLKKINGNICEFFLLNNFGCRQSKGFGSFLVSEINNNVVSYCENNTSSMEKTKNIVETFKNDKRAVLKITLGNTVENDLESRMKCFFKSALTVYSIMKNGVNSTLFTSAKIYNYNNPRIGVIDPNEEGKYSNKSAIIKGFLRTRFYEGCKSDKAFIKANVIKAISPKRYELVERSEGENYFDIVSESSVLIPEEFKHRYDSCTSEVNYKFVRAMMGLADKYEFKDDTRCSLKLDKRKKEIIKANNSGILCPQYEANNIEVIHFHGTKIKESDGKKSVIASAENIKTDNGIKRFKSPVQIKMFTRGDLKCIYFLLDESYKTMLSQVFFFLTKTDKNEFKRIIKNKNYEEVARFLGKCHWLSTPDSFDPEAFFGKFVEFWKECREKETNWAESNNKINEPLLGKGYDRLNNITVSKL